MSKQSFNVERSLRLKPIDLTTLTSPKNGELAIDVNDSNKLKKYNEIVSAWEDTSPVEVTNYILNPNAQNNTFGWATYANTPGAAPISGTGGSPTVTLTRSTSAPLRGNASFLYTKPSSNVQGQGFSYDFTIDSADTGKVLQGSFDYQIASGTFADNDMSVWIYDITNARLIQPAPYLIKNSGIVERFPFEFQTAINSTSYRLIFHIGSTSASAYSLKFDNFQVGPSAKLYGSAVTDWIDFTPVWTASTTNPTIGNGTLKGKWRRVGDSVEIQTFLIFGSTSTKGSGTYNLSLPTGMVADLNKLPNGTILNSIGSGQYFSQLSVANTQVQGAFLTSTTTYNMATDQNSISNTFSSGQTNVFTSVSDNWSTHVKIPIVGWSSSQVMSSDASTRVVVGYASSSALVSLNTLATVITTANIIADTHAGFTGSTYVVKVPGFYKIKGSVYINNTAGSGVNGFCRIVAGGYTQDVGSTYLFTGQGTAASGELVVPLNAGQTIQLQAYVGAGTGNAPAANSTYISIERISGPSQIMASESVSALYTGAPPTGTLSASSNLVTYGTKIKDSHGAYLSGLYPVPMSGVYDVSAAFRINTNFTSVGQIAAIVIAIDGLDKYQGYYYTMVTGSQNVQLPINVKSIPLKEGQTLSIRSYVQGTSPTFLTDSTTNFFSLTRTGNY